MYQVTKTERGWAAHFIGAEQCRFIRNTLIECEETGIGIIVSTVGNLCNSEGALQPIGANRHYETMAFRAVQQGYYVEADTYDTVSFNSPWCIDTDSPDFFIECADNLANDMHENVVKELYLWLQETGGVQDTEF